MLNYRDRCQMNSRLVLPYKRFEDSAFAFVILQE